MSLITRGTLRVVLRCVCKERACAIEATLPSTQYDLFHV